jgi:hypothetical protein
MTAYQNTRAFSLPTVPAASSTRRAAPEDIRGLNPSETPSNASRKSTRIKRKGTTDDQEYRPRPDLL